MAETGYDTFWPDSGWGRVDVTPDEIHVLAQRSRHFFRRSMKTMGQFLTHLFDLCGRVTERRTRRQVEGHGHGLQLIGHLAGCFS